MTQLYVETIISGEILGRPGMSGASRPPVYEGGEPTQQGRVEVSGRDFVYRRILQVVQDILKRFMEGDRVYLAAGPVWDSNDDVAVQIVPGTAFLPHTGTAGGIRTEQFEVVFWNRFYAEPGPRQTREISSAQKGMMQWHDLLEGQSDSPGLAWSVLGGYVLGVVELLSVGQAIKVFADGQYPTAAWLRMVSTYRMIYELDRIRTATYPSLPETALDEGIS